MKDELGGKIMAEFVTLRTGYSIDDGDENKNEKKIRKV